MESSRKHFQVLGLGLEASSPRKLPCPRLEDSIIFLMLKICRSAEKIFVDRFFEDRLKNFFEDLFFLENTCVCVLGPWPRECLSSEKLSLALDFFVP